MGADSMVILFIMEFRVIFVLDGLKGLPSPLQIYPGSSLMLGLVFPALYFLIFQPWRLLQANVQPKYI